MPESGPADRRRRRSRGSRRLRGAGRAVARTGARLRPTGRARANRVAVDRSPPAIRTELKPSSHVPPTPSRYRPDRRTGELMATTWAARFIARGPLQARQVVVEDYVSETGECVDHGVGDDQRPD